MGCGSAVTSSPLMMAPPAEPSTLTHVAATSSTIRRQSTASTSTVATSCQCDTTAPAPRASSANADTAPRTRGGHSRHVRSGQGLDELLPVDHPAPQHRFGLGESDRDSFRLRAKLLARTRAAAFRSSDNPNHRPHRPTLLRRAAIELVNPAAAAPGTCLTNKPNRHIQRKVGLP